MLKLLYLSSGQNHTRFVGAWWLFAFAMPLKKLDNGNRAHPCINEDIFSTYFLRSTRLLSPLLNAAFS